MKQFLFKTIFATIFLISGVAGKLYAYHNQGGEITYTCISLNTYEIKCRLYQDCAALQILQPIINLDLKAPGCNVGRTVIMTKVATNKTGDPYCSSLGNSCGTLSRENHLEAIYTAIVSFSAAEAACPNWLLSTTFNARPATANLVNTQVDLYLEAYLKLGSGINNSSATRNTVAPTVEYVCVGQETRLSLATYDPDCDSLSYELVAPLNSPGVAYSYKPLNAFLSGFVVNPNPPAPYCNTCTPPNQQFGYLPPPVPGNFSATFPISSFNANWNTINPATGIPYQFVPLYPYFELTQAGELRFRPAVYFNTPPVQGDNKYAVVVKINEWRKVNGIMTNVGYTRRDMLFIVADCSGNENPSISAISVSPLQSPTDTIIRIQAGARLNLNFSTFDQSADTLTIDTDVTTQLPGATFTQTSAAKPTGTITWTVPSTNGNCGIRYFYVRIKDNACPIRGKKVFTFGVKVVGSGAATGIKEEQDPGLFFTAYPNPFSENATFRFESKNAGREIKIFNLLGEEIDRIKLTGSEKEIAWQQASKFAAGMYVAKLITKNNTVQTLKFSKLQ